jgi:hypothetical protein
MAKPVVLIFDIETAPLEVLTWGQRDQYISPEQVIEDLSILSFSAKYLKDASGNVYGPHNKVMHFSTAKQRNRRDDKKVVQKLRDLIDEAHFVLGQNSNRFDLPIFQGRCEINEIEPPSSYKKEDTYRMGSKMGFTSTKLAHMTKHLCPELEKSIHKKFPGLSLWTEFLKGNKEAHKEMEHYNNQDVLGTEGVFNRLAKWGTVINFGLFEDDPKTLICACGSRDFKDNGHSYEKSGKYKRYKCKKCGAPHKGGKVKE